MGTGNQAWNNTPHGVTLHLSPLPFMRVHTGRLLTYVCKHAHTCKYTHNPDTDDSLYPFANQLYMSRGKERERELAEKCTSCWCVNRSRVE